MQDSATLKNSPRQPACQHRDVLAPARRRHQFDAGFEDVAVDGDAVDGDDHRRVRRPTGYSPTTPTDR
jgi:hypothetical protein